MTDAPGREIIAFRMDPQAAREPDRHSRRRARALEDAQIAMTELRKVYDLTLRDADSEDQ